MKEMSRYAVEMENISKIYTLKTKDKAKKKTQFYALKDEILNTFRQIHYIKILIALSVGSIVSLWVKILNLECFFSLVLSSLLFFGAYGFVLLILKEELFLEIFNTIKNKII